MANPTKLRSRRSLSDVQVTDRSASHSEILMGTGRVAVQTRVLQAARSTRPRMTRGRGSWRYRLDGVELRDAHSTGWATLVRSVLPVPAGPEERKRNPMEGRNLPR